MNHQALNKPNVLISTYTAKRGNKTSQLARELNDATSEAELSTDLFLFDTKRKQLLKHPSLHQIKGPSGSVRGHKDVVRQSVENIIVSSCVSRRNFSCSTPLSYTSNRLCSSFLSPSFGEFLISNLAKFRDESYRTEYLTKLVQDEQDHCVLYTTSLGVIRRSFEDSKQLRSILNLNLICFEERDIYLNQEYRLQLRLRSENDTFVVPKLFVDGQFLGGIKEVESMNEDGSLSSVLARFKTPRVPKRTCSCCGDAKFIACPACNGSRKSTIRHFKFNSIALRCIRCDKNDGLVRCPLCSTSSSSLASLCSLMDSKSTESNGKISFVETNAPEVSLC